MTYDCFLFNDELDMLELRLTYMNKYVDYFILVESSLTFSGNGKPLHYLQNKDRFKRFNDKIIYCQAPPTTFNSSWDVESYQRNYIKEGLKTCDNDDLVIIADADEIINMEEFIKIPPIQNPVLIEMVLFYYFINLKTNTQWKKTLVSPYKYLKETDLGNRDLYNLLNPLTVGNLTKPMGWHFSYVFGLNLDLYLNKLKSFSHQEYNTSYFLDRRRIESCLKLRVDILERNSIYKPIRIETVVSPELYNALIKTDFIPKYLYSSPENSFYFSFFNIKYFIKFRLKPQISSLLKRLKASISTYAIQRNR